MAPHLLLLPGMLCDEAFWRAQIAALSDISIPVVASYGSADRIETMAEMVLEEAPESFALAGHSMGGRVALEVYKRAPQRVLRLGLFCSDYRGATKDPDRQEENARRNELLELARTEGMHSAGQAWARRVLAPACWDDRELVAAVIDMVCRHSPRRLEAQIHAGLAPPDHTALLAAVSCPALVCAGAEDTMRPASVPEALAAGIPGARLAVIPRSGHMIAMERPKALNTAMRTWLSE